MKKLRRFAVILPLLLVAALCSCAGKEDADVKAGSLTAHFLNVGQGDCAFVELPDGRAVLIDAAENYYGEGIIGYIRQTGHDKIDYLVASHPHSDHIGSMGYIVRHMDVGACYMPRATNNTKAFEKLLESLENRSVPVAEAGSGVVMIDDGGVKAEFLAPVSISENLNNCSAVLRLSFGKTTFLFTGDAETEELSEITADLSADVLKVSHHGSADANTAETLGRINPKTAVISCGAGNDFGHPHKETLDLLGQMGAKVYRTDLDGTVTVSSDGKSITVTHDNMAIERAK